MKDDERTGMNPALKIILIVAGVLCLLACIGIALAGWLVNRGVTGLRSQMELTQTQVQMEVIATALDQHRLMHQELPASLDELVGPDGRLATDEVPTDAWGHAFFYERAEDGTTYTLLSYGADGLEGGEAENADITHEPVDQR